MRCMTGSQSIYDSEQAEERHKQAEREREEIAMQVQAQRQAEADSMMRRSYGGGGTITPERRAAIIAVVGLFILLCVVIGYGISSTSSVSSTPKIKSEAQVKTVAEYADEFKASGIEKAKSKDWNGALTDLNAALLRRPEMADELKPYLMVAYFMTASKKEDNGDLDGAIADFTKGLTNIVTGDDGNQNRIFVYCNLAAIKARKGDNKGAIEYYTMVIELNPKDDEVYVNRGIAKANQQDMDGAMLDYNKAIELKPDNNPAYDNRGYAKQSKGENEAAIADFTKAIEIKPDDDFAFYYRGVAKRASGDLAGALSDFRDALKNKPADLNFQKALEKVMSEMKALEAQKPSPDQIISITNLQGKTYTNIRIVKDVPDGIYFVFTGTNMAGGGEIYFDDLPVIWRQIYNYSPTDAAAYKQAVSDEKASYMAKYAAAGQALASASTSATRNAAEDKSSSSGDISVSGFSAKVTEKNSTYWSYAYQFKAKNNGSFPRKFDAYVKLLDESGFVIDDVWILETLAGGEERTFSDRTTVEPQQGEKIKSYRLDFKETRF